MEQLHAQIINPGESNNQKNKVYPSHLLSILEGKHWYISQHTNTYSSLEKLIWLIFVSKDLLIFFPVSYRGQVEPWILYWWIMYQGYVSHTSTDSVDNYQCSKTCFIDTSYLKVLLLTLLLLQVPLQIRHVFVSLITSWQFHNIPWSFAFLVVFKQENSQYKFLVFLPTCKIMLSIMLFGISQTSFISYNYIIIF